MKDQTRNRKKFGLALGSGGVKGLVHVGFLKVIEKAGIKVDYIAGSSIGALIGAHYALYKDAAELEKFIATNRKEKLKFLLDPGFKGGIISGLKMEQFISDTLGDADFKDLKIPFKAVATDLVRGERVVFSKGKLAPAIRASMTVPYIFQPIVLSDMVLVDGGVCSPVPDDIVKKMGAEVVISINLDNYSHENQFKASDLASLNVFFRSIDILRHHLSEHSIKNSDFIISPPLPLVGFEGWTHYFTREIAQELILVGESEAHKILIKLKNKLAKESRLKSLLALLRIGHRKRNLNS